MPRLLILVAVLLVTGARALASVPFGDCEALSEAQVRQEIRAASHTGIQTAFRSLTMEALVAEAWRAQAIGATLEDLAREAAEEARRDNGYARRLLSAYHPGTATAIAERMTARVFESPVFEAQLEVLTTAVAREVSSRLTLARSETEAASLRCLQAFLAARYHASVGSALESAMEGGRSMVLPDIAADVTPDMLSMGTAASGIALMVMRRSVGRVASAMVPRLAALIAARLASVASAGLGMALIGWEMFTASDGVIPQVTAEMTGAETAVLIKAEIAASLREAGNRNLPGVAEASADRLIGQWLAFRQRYRLVLDWAERELQFRNMLFYVRPEQLPNLAEAMELLAIEGGEAAIRHGLADGTLARSLDAVPDAFAIARQAGSLRDGLAWARLAPGRLDAVRRLQLPKLLAPDHTDAREVGFMLALDDPSGIRTLAAIDPPFRRAAVALPVETARRLLRAVSPEALAPVLDLMRHFGPEWRLFLADRVLSNPGAADALRSAKVRTAIIRSSEPRFAADLMLTDRRTAAPATILGDLRAVMQQKLGLRIWWRQHGLAAFTYLAMSALGLLALIQWLWRSRRKLAAAS